MDTRLAPEILERISDAFVALDHEWRCTHLNRKAGEIFGCDPDSLIGRHLWTEMLEGTGERFQLACERAVREQVPVTLQDHVLARGRWFDGRIYPSPEGVSVFFSEITERKRAEAALRESEARYRSLFDASLDAVYAVAPDGRFSDANRACAQLTGYSLPELLQMSFVPLFAPEEMERVVGYFRSTLAGEAHNFDSTAVRKDGFRVELNITVVPRIEAGVTVGVFGIARDITRRVRMERELRFRAGLLEAQKEATPDGILVVDREDRPITWNRRFVEMWGVDEELLARGPAARALASVLPLLADPEAALVRIDELYRDPHGEAREEVRLSDGRVLDRHTAPVRAPDGEVLGRIWCYRDITEEVRVKGELYRRGEILQRIFDSVPVMIAFFDAEGRYQWVNRAWEETLGYSLAEAQALGMSLFYSDPERRAEVLEFIRRAEPGWRDFHTRTRDGRMITTSWANVRLLDGSTIGIGQDVSARREAEAEREWNRLFLRTVIDASPSQIFVKDTAGRFTLVNRAMAAFYQMTPEEMVGQTDADLGWPPDRVELFRRTDREAEAGREVRHPAEPVTSPRTGAVHWFEAHKVPLAVPGGEPLVLGVATDVSEHMRAVRALGESEQRFRQITENVREIFWMATPAFTEYLYLSPAFAEIWGRPPEGFYRDPRAVLRSIHPDDRAPVESTMERLSLGREAEVEYRVVHPGGEVRWVHSRGFPVRDESGAFYRIAGVTEDVTRRKLAEMERAELLRREHALRMEAEAANRAKSDFLGIVSHELRTPLAAVITYAELLEDELAGVLDERQRKHLLRIGSNAWHLSELVREILEFTRLERDRVELQTERVDLAALARELAQQMRPAAEARGLDLRVEGGTDPVAVETDATKARQILTNLLSNAVKFTPAGSVTLALAERDDAAEVQVRDTGIGIAPEDQERIFEPFTQVEASLTRRGEGLGLGLAIVRRLVELLGGTLALHSRPGEGSTFAVRFPRAAAARHASGRQGDGA